MTFAERIQRLQRLLNLTQGQLAEIFGVSVLTIHNWHAGKVIPKHDCQQTLLRLEASNLAALSPHISADTVRAFREGRAR
jgi:DNA-binding transcriptional regulator YiaG